jgi:ComF family protein
MSLGAKKPRSEKLAAIANSAADVLFPGRCLLCGSWLMFAAEPGAVICSGCRTRLVPLDGERCGVCSIPLMSELGLCTRCRGTEYSFSRNHSVFAYAAELKDLVKSYKFSGRVRLSGLFAEALAAAARREFPGAPVVPAPARPGADGPDHVGRIAGIMRRKHGLTVSHLLVRAAGSPQKTLDLEERRRNLRGKISLRTGCRIPERVVLLDDVFTTGATADACASALRAGGCREIGVLTLAIEE